MKLENVKVGQRVFVTRDSTAKLDELDRFAMNLVKLANSILGQSVVEICNEEGGFYVAEITKEGNVCLGKKTEEGKFEPGWGVYDPSDFELADEEKEETEDTELEGLLREMIVALKEIKELCINNNNSKPEKKRGRGRPSGSTIKKYNKKGE